MGRLSAKQIRMFAAMRKLSLAVTRLIHAVDNQASATATRHLYAVERANEAYKKEWREVK